MAPDRSELYRPLDAAMLADPYPAYRRLQCETPVIWHGDLFAWVVSGHRDCKQVLQDPATFTRDRQKLGRLVPADGMSIQSLDPPDQIALRQALLSALRRVDLPSLCRRVCEGMDTCMRGQRAGRAFDFMAQVAAPLAMRFACLALGMPERPPATYFSIFARLTRAMDSALDPARQDLGYEATRELNALIVAARHAAAPGSVIHELHRIPGVAQMPAPYVRNTLAATFNAAYSTAYSAMGSFLLVALDHPGLARRIVGSGNVAAGVQELLRYTSPAQSTRRFATRDILIGGMLVHQNDPVLTLLAAANRDPAVFAHPDTLVPARAPNPHLSFGAGPHHCAGARPAAVFLGEFIVRLATWEATLALAGSGSWLDTFTLRCLDRLPVVRLEACADEGEGERCAC